MTYEDASAFIDEYNKEHRCCPKCGSSHIRKTFMGCVLTLGKENEYRNTNDAVCVNCGFECIIHDLKSEI